LGSDSLPLTRKELFNLCLIWLVCSLSSSCTTTTPSYEFGIQPNHAGYVPARIAIVPCQDWPNGSQFKNLPLSNIKKIERSGFCDSFDKFILEGFTGQPYMRGYSPGNVAKKLIDANKADFLSTLPEQWRHLDDDCNRCENLVAFYGTSIAPRPEWQLWLKDLSQNINYADALLLPFFVHGYERKVNDRGLLIAERSASISLLLIDTGTGSLLWAGGRTAVVTNKVLERRDVMQDLEFPPWGQAADRLFVEELWREFPGRQVF
jgi:hypothetical protein